MSWQPTARSSASSRILLIHARQRATLLHGCLREALSTKWIQEDGESVEEVARHLRRNRSPPYLGAFRGRAWRTRWSWALRESGKDRLVALADNMIKQGNVRWLATADIIQQKFAPKLVSVRTLRNGLRGRGVCGTSYVRSPSKVTMISSRGTLGHSRSMGTRSWLGGRPSPNI